MSALRGCVKWHPHGVSTTTTTGVMVAAIHIKWKALWPPASPPSRWHRPWCQPTWWRRSGNNINTTKRRWQVPSTKASWIRHFLFFFPFFLPSLCSVFFFCFLVLGFMFLASLLCFSLFLPHFFDFPSWHEPWGLFFLPCLFMCVSWKEQLQNIQLDRFLSPIFALVWFLKGHLTFLVSVVLFFVFFGGECCYWFGLCLCLLD